MYLRGLVNCSLFAEDNRVVISIWSADGLASSFVFRLSFELNTVNRRLVDQVKHPSFHKPNHPHSTGFL